MKALHDLFFEVGDWAAILIELIALVTAIITIFRALYELFFIYKLDFSLFNESETLPAGMIATLEVMMVAEILKTVLVTQNTHLYDLLTLVILVLVRTFLSYHLEKSVDKRRMKKGSKREEANKEKLCS